MHLVVHDEETKQVSSTQIKGSEHQVWWASQDHKCELGSFSEIALCQAALTLRGKR